jgi:hypothetical protein
MNAKLFINYRREDTAPYAGRLYDRLTAHFGEDQVFIDIDQIEPGEDFVEAINRKVGTCDIAIVAIGPNWLGATDASGKRRLDDEGDFVRMEIVAALQRKIRVIPVLVGGAHMPGREDLPEALAPLSRRNAIELSETRFHADVNRLIEAIEKSLAVVEEKTELSATPVAPAKGPTTAVKSAQITQAVPPGASISAVAASKEPALWRRKRLITVTAGGAAVLLLFTITVLFMRPHISVRKTAALDQNGIDEGDAAAQNNLGVSYRDGNGLPKDSKKAAELFKKAADQGYAAAQNNLGMCYLSGEGVQKDLKKAAELFQKAADEGDAAAQNSLGASYANGEGVTKDLKKAAELFQKAADQGNPKAQYNLGVSYENGEGVTKDLKKAAELFQKAADQGNVQALHDLAVCYLRGEGVQKDSNEAAELFKKAADQGNVQALYELRFMSDAQIESLRSFELAFIDEFAVPVGHFNATAFEARMVEGTAKFREAIASEKLTARNRVLIDLSFQFDVVAAHLRSKANRGKATPALASEMKKDVNKIYDLALSR